MAKKMIEDPRLLAHKRQVERERRAQAILRRKHERLAAFERIANAPEPKSAPRRGTEFTDVVLDRAS